MSKYVVKELALQQSQLIKLLGLPRDTSLVGVICNITQFRRGLRLQDKMVKVMYRVPDDSPFLPSDDSPITDATTMFAIWPKNDPITEAPIAHAVTKLYQFCVNRKGK